MSELQTTEMVRSDFGGNVCKHFTSGGRMAANTVDTAFSDLNAGSSQLDQAFHEPAFDRF